MDNGARSELHERKSEAAGNKASEGDKTDNDPFSEYRSGFKDIAKPDNLRLGHSHTSPIDAAKLRPYEENPQQKMLQSLAEFGSVYERKAAQSIDKSDDGALRSLFGLGPDGKISKETLKSYWDDHDKNFLKFVTGKAQRPLPNEHYSVSKAYAAKHFVDNWDSPDLKPYKNSDDTLNAEKIYNHAGINWRDFMAHYRGPESAAEAGKIAKDDNPNKALYTALVNISAIAKDLDKLDGLAGMRDGQISKAALRKYIEESSKKANQPNQEKHAENFKASAELLLQNWDSKTISYYKSQNNKSLRVEPIIDQALMNSLFSRWEK